MAVFTVLVVKADLHEGSWACFGLFVKFVWVMDGEGFEMEFWVCRIVMCVLRGELSDRLFMMMRKWVQKIVECLRILNKNITN